MSVGLSLQSLTQEFEQTKERLRVVEDDIRKHSGRRNVPSSNFRHPRDAPPGLRSQLANRLDDGPLRRRPQGGAFSRLGRQLNVHEVQRMGQPSPQGPAGPHQGPVSAKDQPRPGGGPHGIGPPGGAPGARMPVKRERPDREQPEDVDADEGPPRKVGLLSSIGASSFTVKGKSRSELLSEQSGDQNVKARNRRMFGMILGTLKSFEKEESTKRKEQVDKKVEKEQKVEEQKEREKEEAVRQRRELIEEKRDKQIKLRQLQAKMEVVGAFEEFSKRHGYMANFIHTAAKPPLMWLPRVHTPASEDSLARSRAKIEAIVAKEQQRVELELERIEGVHRDSDGEADGKENNSGSTMPSSVAVVVNNDHKDVAEADSKQNGSTDKTPAQEKTAVDPLMKNIKIIIENDLAVKKGVNGKRENADDDEVDEEAATGDEVDEVEPRQETLEEELQQEPRRHDTESKDDESDHEDEVTIRSKDEEDDPKDENAERGRSASRSRSKSRSKSRSRSESNSGPRSRPVSTVSPVNIKPDPEDQPMDFDPPMKHPKKASPAAGDAEGHDKKQVTPVARDSKRTTAPGDGSPRRSQSPKKTQPSAPKKRGSSSSSSSSSTSASSRSSSSSSNTNTNSTSSESPRRPSKKTVPVSDAGSGSPKKRSNSTGLPGRKTPPTRVRRPSASPVPPKRRGSSPPAGRRSRSPKRRSRSPRRRSPSSPVRRGSVKRRSVSRRRSPRRRRRSSSPRKRSGSIRRRVNRRSGSRGPPRRANSPRRRTRSRSPRRVMRRSRSPRRRR